MGTARTHGARRAGRWPALVGACIALCGLAAAPARAADAVIDGSPLNIYADDTGRLQVAFDGSGTGEFFLPSLAPANAGFNIAVRPVGSPDPYAVFGFQGSPFTRSTAPTVTGSGTAADPFVLTTTYATGPTGSNPTASIVQRVIYVNGATDVGVQYDVAADTDTQDLDVRVYEAADLYVAGNDAGTGFFDPGPPRQVGGINDALGSSGRLVEQSPAWTHYQEGAFGDVFSVISSAGAFSDTTDATLLDNGVGVQWDIPSVPHLQTRSVSVVWRFKRFTALQLTLASSTQTTGQIATVTVAARNSDGNPDPGRSVRYSISGANPSAGAVTTGGDGTAAISWRGAQAGVDTVNAFVDLNGNGVRDANEPQQQASVTWTAAPPPPPPSPPVPGKSVVVKVVSGQVFIRRAAPRGVRATSPPKGFVPFTGAANIPVGSQLDTRKGRVALTSAADTGGKKTQTSDFYQGIFQVRQALPKKKSKKAVALTTDIVLKGQVARSQCAPLKRARSAAVSAKKKGPKGVLGKLWGNGKGKFRTTGKYSSATVRGTIWLTQDECDGTLTKVQRGTVSVRDFRRRKTVTVKARHSYLARAPRAASKGRRK